MSTEDFYRDFEAAFRGNRQEIIGRLRAYEDFLKPLLEVTSERRVIDLGCGRGEWLELVGSLGFSAHGVDLDAGMLKDCYALGLSAEQGDAIAHLRSLSNGSQAVVSGFHIAEHLPFEVLQELIREAMRVLEPGGLLILETPNPENLRVGTLSFHMDPTHNKPLPPGLLSFLPRHYGFARSQVVRLQESAALKQAPSASLFQVFEGVSPDYAVVAQKTAAEHLLARFDAAFARDRGLTLETLSDRFEEQYRRQINKLTVELDRTRNDFEDHRTSADQKFREISERFDAVYTSTSWRVTAPLRGTKSLASSATRLLREQTGVVKGALHNAGLRMVLEVHKRPAMRKLAVDSIRRVPGLEARLRGLLAAGSRTTVEARRHHVAAQLTPRGSAIYERLRKLRDRS